MLKNICKFICHYGSTTEVNGAHQQKTDCVHYILKTR